MGNLLEKAAQILAHLISAFLGAVVGALIGMVVGVGIGTDGFNAGQQDISIPIGVLIFGSIGFVGGAYFGWMLSTE